MEVTFGDDKEMYNRNNAALDFEVVQKPRKAKVISLPSKKARRLAKLKSRRMLMTWAFTGFCACALGVSCFVLGQVQLTEITDKSYKAAHDLEQLQSLNTQLSVKLKSVTTTNSFEEKCDTPVEIVKLHKGDIAKRS